MPDKPVRIDKEAPLAVVTISRPSRLNALDEEAMVALAAAFEALEADEEVEAVVLTGEGEAFSSGGDLRFGLEAGPEALVEVVEELAEVLHGVVTTIRTMAAPVVGAINGVAAGGGFGLALACDLRVMAEGAYLRQAATRKGLVVGGGGSYLLPRMVGMARAQEVMLLDEPLDATRCLDLGLATRVCPPESLMDEARALALRAARVPRATRELMKRLFAATWHVGYEEHLRLEREALVELVSQGPALQGIERFVKG